MERAATADNPAESAAARRGGKYLLFQLRNEQFGLDVMQVREIIGLQRITAVPHMPPYVRGVINLRGKVVPVIDLRTRLGFKPEDFHARTCTIVVETPSPRGELLIGLVVDAVSEVVHIPPELIQAPPDFADSEPRPYVLGMAKLGDRVSILLAIDQVLATGERLDLAASVDRSDAEGA